MSGTGQPAADVVRDGPALADDLGAARSDQHRITAFTDYVAGLGLGADQAHLTNDFRRFIGVPPGSWQSDLIAEHVSGPPQPITPPT